MNPIKKALLRWRNSRREATPATVRLDFPTTQATLDVFAKTFARRGLRVDVVEAEDPMGNTIRSEVPKQ